MTTCPICPICAAASTGKAATRNQTNPTGVATMPLSRCRYTASPGARALRRRLEDDTVIALAATIFGRPVQHAAFAQGQRRDRLGAVGSVEIVQHSLAPTPPGLRQSK